MFVPTYKYKRVNKLTPANEGNEAPHRQNDHIWAPFDPDEEAVCKVQGAKKVMCWAVQVGDTVLTLHWMDEEHRPRTMTEESYGEMLRTEVWAVSVVVATGRRRTPLH